MQNYQGLLNPSNFAQNQMAPQGGSYWMQYAQRPSPLALPIPAPQGGTGGTGGGSGTPTAPGTPTTPTPPVTPPRPPGPAGGGDSGWGANRPGQTPRPQLGFNSPVTGPYPTNIGGYDVNGPIPRGLAQNIFSYYADKVKHDSFMTDRMGAGANTAYYKEWLPRQYWGMAQRMNMYPEQYRKQGWNMVRDGRGDNPQADILPGGRR